MPIKTSYKHGTPSWVDLSTTDQQAAKTFYGSLFGWEWEDNDMGNGSLYSMAKLKGEYAAAIYQQGQEEVESGIQPHWNTYITVDDIEAATAKVAPAGGKVIAPPFEVYDSGKMSVISDPTGGVVGFWQPVNHIGAGIVGEPGALAWNELITDDVDTAAAFFKEVLGVEIARQEQPFISAAMLVDGHVAGGLMAKPGSISHVPNGWALDFAVADCDSSAKKAESLGAAVIMQPRDVPPGRFAVLRDPQGAVFSVIKLNRV